ncbi:MAG: class I SAM-dependent methyltransferase [Gemmatimonadaceae bacterium]
MSVWILVALLSIALMAVSARYLTERARRKQQGVFSKWPIPSITLEMLDDAFTSGPFGPTLAAEVSFIGRGPLLVAGGTSDTEAWVLSVLAKKAQQLFEFGTCTGKTAYLWSRNAPTGAKIVTITLAPSQQGDYDASPTDSREDTTFALRESVFENFIYTNTAVESAITQLYGDSKQLNESEWKDWADLIFVDGSHARSYVESDSRKAMAMVKPGGLVLWHDYAGPRHASGVFLTLNELSKEFDFRRVEGTTFVAWRRPIVQ